jgi:phosphonate transport system substrate-binding protein
LVEGAAVDGHKWDYYEKQNSAFTAQTRVIKKSDPFGSPPLVASLFLPEEVFAKLSRVVLTMHDDSEGKRILDKLMIDRFVPTQDKWYDPVRQMYLKTHEGEVSHDPKRKS